MIAMLFMSKFVFYQKKEVIRKSNDVLFDGNLLILKLRYRILSY